METQTIHKKLIHGFLGLTFRQTVLLGINFLTINIILARILPVEVIGIFNIGNTILSFFTYFSDIGLAAALIQKKEITKEDLKTTFLTQEILAVLITIAVWFSAEYFASIYKLDMEGVWLIRALAVSFLFTSFKVVPSVLLERDLKFAPLVWVDILESIFYNAGLILLTYMNFSINAFSISAIIRSIVGLISIYLVAPWRPLLGFSKTSMKDLLRFGAPFQLNSILALLKDRLVPLIIANIVGPLGVGFITWAQGLAFLPLMVMNILIRITFPAFSRLQDNRVGLKNALERSIFLTSLLAYPLIFGIIAISPSLIEYVVTDKWKPALPLIFLFSINSFWAILSTTFTNVLNAVGKIGITLKLMVMWTILTWVISPFMAMAYGFVGVGIASAIISFTSIIPILITKKIINVRIIPNIWQPLVASILMAGMVYFLALFLVRDYLSTIVTILLGGFIYILIVFLISQRKVVDAVKGVEHDRV